MSSALIEALAVLLAVVVLVARIKPTMLAQLRRYHREELRRRMALLTWEVEQFAAKVGEALLPPMRAFADVLGKVGAGLIASFAGASTTRETDE
jgi:hypothetical protein